MYLRFQGRVPNSGTPNKLGIFQLAYDLRRRTDAPEYAREALQVDLDWLCQHLASPSVLSRPENRRAICWFKAGAAEPIAHIWPMKVLLEDYGYPIDVVRSRRPGWIVYEDNWQVVAKPDRWSRIDTWR